MSGSSSSVPGAPDAAESGAPLSFTVHSLPTPAELLPRDAGVRRTVSGRVKMLLVLLVCAAPVVASYFTYFVIRPEGRTNYSELILPTRPLPNLAFTDLAGQPVPAERLKGQWLLLVVAGGACDQRCERYLWIQRQLRETLGRDKDRIDKVWLINDGAAPRPELLQAIGTGEPATVLRVAPAELATWLTPASGHALEDHMALVDPMGQWMMRVPVDPEPGRLKRDIERLLRASAAWDQPGR